MSSFLITVIALFLNVAIPLALPYFLVAIPLLPYTGKWIENPDQMNMVTNVSQSYFEALFVLFLFVSWLKAPDKDKTSKQLLLLPLATVLSFLSVRSWESFAISSFIFLTFLCGPGVYRLFMQKMEFIRKRRVVDLTVLAWSVLSVFNKFYLAYTVYDTDPLFTRHGGIWASNHAAIIEILLLPLVQSQFVFWSAIVVLVLHFSRGVYLVLAIYAVLWFLLIDRKRAAMAISGFAAAVILFAVTFPTAFGIVAGGITDRLAAGNLWAKGAVGQAMTQEMVEDDRYVLHQKAFEMVYKTQLRGVGLGSFLYGLPLVDFPPEYSNAHNLYLTALAEGGVPFFIAVTAFLAVLLWRAYKADRRMFVGLLCFAVYGYYSGELYNASGQITSGDYYYLLFCLAYVQSRLAEKKNAIGPSAIAT